MLWVNDSKATNVAAAVSAIRSLEERSLVLLLGGKDKGENLEPLADAITRRARVAIVYGAAGDRIAQALSGRVVVAANTGSLRRGGNGCSHRGAEGRSGSTGSCVLEL